MAQNAIETVRYAEQKIIDLREQYDSKVSQLHKEKKEKILQFQSEFHQLLESYEQELNEHNQEKLDERKALLDEEIVGIQRGFESDFNKKSDAIADKIVQEVVGSYGNRQNEEA